jgi:transcription antitermination factor NusG
MCPPWFAVRVRSRQERVVAVHLRGRGFEEYYPTYEILKQWSDRKKLVTESLLPGYVFCRFDPNNRLPILSAPGVVGVVGFGDGPTPIPDEEVERVRRMAESGLLVSPWPFLKTGQRVLIERGPLLGLEGLLQTIKGKHRLVVSITLLQRSVATEIDRSWIRPIGPAPQEPARTR